MSDWKQVAEAKRDSVLSLIPPEWRLQNIPPAEEVRDITGTYLHQYLTDKEVEITETDATEIVKQTSSGVWTAYEVTKAFCHRAALAHQLVSCLHEIFFDQALESARLLDEHYAKTKTPLGPLHGLPVSLKDQFHVKGVETHMGYVGWIGTFQGQKGTGKEKVFESELVKALRAQGAVLYVKTSVPHTLMSGETTNNIIDFTFNPTNRYLGSGGSSGGEGALIAAKGSPLGFGTDIGGSVRIPAAFNGLYGLRTSTGRLPYQGMANSWDGAPSILSIVGPLAPSATAIELSMKAVLETQPWLYDPLVHPLPWRSQIEQETRDRITKGFSFGVYASDGVCSLHPPVKRAIQEVIAALERANNKLIQWNPPSHKRLQNICNKAWSYDAWEDGRKAFALSGEPPKPDIGPEDVGGPVPPSRIATPTDIMNNEIDKREAQKEYLDYWNSTKNLTGTGKPVDAIIAPVAPFAAARPRLYTCYNYTPWVNALDYTSIVVPVTKVNKEIDQKDTSFQPLSDIDEETQATYDPEIYDGAHVGIQLVGRRLEEEKMIVLAEYLGSLLRP